MGRGVESSTVQEQNLGVNLPGLPNRLFLEASYLLKTTRNHLLGSTGIGLIVFEAQVLPIVLVFYVIFKGLVLVRPPPSQSDLMCSTFLPSL